MAVTIGSFADIDDTAVDAESPLTESLMTQLRDNAYWIDSSFTKADQGSADYLLETDGSGGVQWIAKSDVSIDGTKGNVNGVSTASGTPDQIAIQTNKILMITWIGDSGVNTGESKTCQIIIDASDDTFVEVSGSSSSSGTVTGTYSTVASVRIQGGDTSDMTLQCKKNGANYEFYSTEDSAGDISSLVYVWL